MFIESIFGGEKNPSTEMSIDDAMKNIEVLIDIHDNFEKFIKLGKEFCSSYEQTVNDHYKEEMIAGLRVFFKSVDHYNKKCVEGITKTYQDIITSMEKRTPAKVETTVPTYQIF